jgi:hypothetical protein
MMRCVRVRQNETRVEFVTWLNLGYTVSKGAMKFTLERHLDEAAEIQRHFIDRVTLEDTTLQVGEALGADIAWDGGQLGEHHTRKYHDRHVEEVCRDSAALRKVVAKYPWLVTLLKRCRAGDLAHNR